MRDRVGAGGRRARVFAPCHRSPQARTEAHWALACLVLTTSAMAILVAADFSHPVRKTIEFAAGLARAVGERVWLTFVQEQAANAPLAFGSALVQVASLKEHAQLFETAEALRAQGIVVETRLIRGSIVESLAALAYELHARFVVMGTQEGGALRQIAKRWGHVVPHSALQVEADVWVVEFKPNSAQEASRPW